MDAESFRADDRCQIVDRILRPGFFVDDEVIEGSNGLEFFMGDFQANCDRFVGFGLAGGEPRCQAREPVRDGEDQNGVFKMGLDRESAVDFGFGDDIVALAELFFDKGTRSSVKVPVVFAPFEETAGIPALHEFAPLEEKVVRSIDFAGAGRAGGR